MKRTKKFITCSIIISCILVMASICYANIIYGHEGWVKWKDGYKAAHGETTCYDNSSSPAKAVEHYTRAQLGVNMIFWWDVRKDSGRCWGTGTSQATSPYGDRDLSAKTFYGR